jgi:RNA polymerase sigma-70 factor (ECF subfamily)
MTTPGNPQLDALVARLADGDRSVFAAVFGQLWPPALHLCKSLLENEADAADAAQEAMQKVFTRAHQYDPTRPALPWALAIAAWECRTVQRRRSRRREVPEAGHPEVGTREEEEEFPRRELIHVAVEAMGKLSEVDREVLLATFWEESASVHGATLRKRRERALTRNVSIRLRH